jgi:hypothetical protein
MKSLIRWIVLCVALLLTSCASTELTSVWTSQDEAEPVTKILVVGVSDSEHQRRVFEDTFVEKINEAGLAAGAGYHTLDATGNPDPDQVLEKVSALDIDAVLVTHVLGVEEKSIFHPPTIRSVPYRYYDSFSGYYRTVYDYVHQPGYTTNHVEVRLETNLYDSASHALLWSAQSRKLDPESTEKLISELSTQVIKGLREAGFF